MSELSFNVPSVEKMGELLPNFDFEAKLKTTGYHAVYLATQKSLDRHVVIKIYSPTVSANPAFQQGFERSTQSIAKLNHVNLIGVFNSAIVEGMAYVVMEFVEGRPLAKHMEAGKLTVPQAVAIAKGMAAGVAYAHEHEVLHGGLGLDNVFLNKKMEAKLGGFGFAIDTGDESLERFSAPELSEPTAMITHEVDVYSMGVILYEMVSGKTYSKDVKSLPTIPGVNPKLREVFKQATAKDPSERFKSAKAFASALDKAAPSATGSGSRLLATGAAAKSPGATGAGSRLLATGAAPKSPGASKKAVVQPLPSLGGGGMKLFRNIVIIILLLIAIKIAWSQKKAKEADVSAQQTPQEVYHAQIVENAKARKMKEARLAIMAAEQAKLQEARNNTQVEPVPEVVEPPKDTWGSLSRLKDKLLAGKRLDMPDGSVRMADCVYLFIDKPMNWYDAAAFAQAYGGHLAVPNLDASLPWMKENLYGVSQQDVWLGAARSGRSAWSLTTGKKWRPKSEPFGTGGYLAANQAGSLIALPPNEARPFMIQWHRDGKNPGSLESLLAKTKNTLDDREPFYPAGTKSYGMRYYYYVHQAVTWQEAVEIAKLSGGHLAVSSGIAERFNLKKLVRSLNAENGIWFGGVYNDNKWQWVTGEEWKQVKWAAGVNTEQPGAALNVMPSKGWEPKDRDDLASGLLIEWSADAK